MMTKYNFLRDNLFLTVSNFLIQIRALILIPLIIKNYGTTTYGSFVLSVLLTQFIFQTSSFGIGYKYQRYLPGTDSVKGKSNLFNSQFILHGTFLIVTLIIYLLIRNRFDFILFKHSGEYSALPFILYVVSYFIWTQLNNYFRLIHNFLLFTINEVVQSYLSIILLIILMYFNSARSLDNILLCLTISLAFLIVVDAFILLREVELSFPKYEIKLVLDDIKLGFPLVLNFYVDFILNSSDKFFIAIFISSTAVAYYSPAYSLAMLLAILPKIFSSVLRPYISRLTDQSSSNDYSKLISLSVKFTFLAGIPFIIFSLIFSKPIIQKLTNISIAENSHYLVPIISLGTFLYGLDMIYSTVLFVNKKTKKIFYSYLYAALLNMVLNVVFISLYKNILIPALTTSISYALSTYLFIKESDHTYFINKNETIKVLISSLFCGMILWWLNRSMIFDYFSNIIISTTIAISIYVFLLFYTKLITVKIVKEMLL